jgi:hypothetical protein
MEMKSYRIPTDIHQKLTDLSIHDGRNIGRMLAQIVRAAHKEVFGED